MTLWSRWRGGTCVNVGCVPKKIMHQRWFCVLVVSQSCSSSSSEHSRFDSMKRLISRLFWSINARMKRHSSGSRSLAPSSPGVRISRVSLTWLPNLIPETVCLQQRTYFCIPRSTTDPKNQIQFAQWVLSLEKTTTGSQLSTDEGLKDLGVHVYPFWGKLNSNSLKARTSLFLQLVVPHLRAQ